VAVCLRYTSHVVPHICCTLLVPIWLGTLRPMDSYYQVNCSFVVKWDKTRKCSRNGLMDVQRLSSCFWRLNRQQARLVSRCSYNASRTGGGKQGSGRDFCSEFVHKTQHAMDSMLDGNEVAQTKSRSSAPEWVEYQQDWAVGHLNGWLQNALLPSQ